MATKFKYVFTGTLLQLSFSCPMAHAQVVFEHITNTTIYDYPEEVTNHEIIELNSAALSYSGITIYQKLKDIELNKKKLNKRQVDELEFLRKSASKNGEAQKNDMLK